MVKPEKRKTRLDKKATGEFVGFGAFAAPEALSASAAEPSSSESQSQSSSFTWTPVYTGPPDAVLQPLLARIGQKRDAVTVTKAIQELQAVFLQSSSQQQSQQSDSKADPNNQSFPQHASIPKHARRPAVRHWAWLYHHTLHAHDAASVRAAAVDAWAVLWQSVPKVTAACLEQHAELSALIFYAARCDPAPEVRAAAERVRAARSSAMSDDSSWEGVRAYSRRVLGWGRASAMPEADGGSKPRSSSSSSSTTDNNNNNNNNDDDALEERYERLVGNCLDAVALWMREHGKDSECMLGGAGEEEDVVNYSKLWWKTLSSPKASLRRKTYQLLSVVVTVTMKKEAALHHQKQQLLPTNLASVLPQAVSAEKEAANVPVLLETVLTVLVHQQQQQSPTPAAEDTKPEVAPSQLMPPTLLVKPLVKLFKKAGYGAKVELWGPILLPLTAQFESQQQQLDLLQAAYDGRDLVMGEADRWRLLTAVAESTAFVLLRDGGDGGGARNDKEDDAADAARKLAGVWLGVLQAVLTAKPSSSSFRRTRIGPAAAALAILCGDLAKQIMQFASTATERRSNCHFQAIADWFWGDEGLSLEVSEPDMLVQLLQDLMQRQSQPIAAPSDGEKNHDDDDDGYSSEAQSRLLPKLRERFRKVLGQYQGSSPGAVVPSDAAYRLFHAILEYGGPASVLDWAANDETGSSVSASTSSPLEKFVMNDLLRWAVIHTSTLSTSASASTDGARGHVQDESLVGNDFGILHRCLSAIPNKRRDLWEAFLREIVAAKCDLGLLVAGLRVLVKKGGEGENDLLRCDTLDRFAIQVGQGTMDGLAARLPHEAEAEDESVDTSRSEDFVYEKKLSFFATCVGLDSDTAGCLVDSQVISKWVETATQPASSSSSSVDKPPSLDTSPTSALFEILLQALKKKRFIFSVDQSERLLLKSWRCSEPFFEVYSADILSSASDLCKQFARLAPQELQEELPLFLTGASATLSAGAWATKAWRVLKVCKDADLPLPSIGIEEINFWQQNPAALFNLSMALFGRIEPESERLALVESWNTKDSTNMMLDRLVSLSGANNNALLAAKSRTRRDPCAKFLAALGGTSLEESVVDDWVRALVIRLSTDLSRSESSELKNFCREVSVLSQLLSLLFDPVIPSAVDALVAEDVSEGDRLWYIQDSKNPSVREEVEVVKVHYDAQAGYYYTIQVTKDGDSQERQTVIDRLRKDQSSRSADGSIPMDCISDEDWSRRSAVLSLILEKLILPHSSLLFQSPSLSELINICTSQIGLGKKRGLGSPQYDIHRCISAADEAVRATIEESGLKAGRDGLWSLSLALGFGLNTPESKWTVHQFLVNPIPLYSLLLRQYTESGANFDTDVDCAVLAWLVVSIETAFDYGEESGETVFRALTLLFERSRCILERRGDNGKFSGPVLIACRAIHVGVNATTQKKVQKIDFGESAATKLSEVMQTALDRLVRGFAMDWESGAVNEDSGATGPATRPEWASLSAFPPLVTSSIDNQSIRDLLATSGTKNAGALSGALYVPSKRYLGLLILDAVARREEALQNVDNVSLSDSTSLRLKSWQEGFEEEEAAEIEEDVYIVAEWVPVRMMADVESWTENEEESDEEIIIGRFLNWLVLLRFIDAAAPKDFRNRPAFVSYLSKCGAVSSILNLALLHNETIYDRKRKAAPTLPDAESLLKDESLMLDVRQLSSLVLIRTIEVLPSLSRRWWEEDCPNVYSNAVQSFVEKYVSPEILKREMGRIKSAASFGPMAISASLVSREVSATYVQDDFSLKVLISLPVSFPFRSAEVDCSKTLGVPQSRWKRWSLQITLMLNNQGGTLQDALMLWKENVDKEFEGVEPCPVCYSVLHVKTHKLPALECKTCHNRFHFDCLTQWFRSSGKSQCVLCQQQWQGTRIL